MDQRVLAQRKSGWMEMPAQTLTRPRSLIERLEELRLSQALTDGSASSEPDEDAWRQTITQHAPEPWLVARRAASLPRDTGQR
jgi:hypothetical protein